MDFLTAIPSALLAAFICAWIAGQRSANASGGAIVCGGLVLMSGTFLGPIASLVAIPTAMVIATFFRELSATSEKLHGYSARDVVPSEKLCPKCGRIIGAATAICPRCMNKL